MRPEVVYGERVAYLPGPDVLVLADLHVGRDRTSNVELPLGEREDLLRRIGAALDRFAPATVVIAGDYTHAFGSVPEGVPETVAAIEDRIASADADLVVTPGNHDAALDRLTGAMVTDSFRAGTALISHGHEPPAVEADLHVVGHEHPVLQFEGRRRPCFLDGGHARHDADLLVLPAFTRLAAGSPVNDLRAGAAQVALLDAPGEARPLVHTGEELLEFPPLSSVRSML